MARSFNGTSDKIVTSGNSGFAINSTFTVSQWVYATASASTGPLVNNSEDSVSFGGIWQYWGVGGATDKYTFILSGEAAVGFAKKSISTALATNTWYHLLSTYDGSQTIAGMKLYVNGSLVATTDNAAAPNTVFTDRPFRMGSEAANVDFFAGRLADGAVWSVVLTQIEISALAAGIRPGRIRRASLIRWWPVDGISSPEPDLSGNASNGTLTGTALAHGPPFTMFAPRWSQADRAVVTPQPEILMPAIQL